VVASVEQEPLGHYIGAKIGKKRWRDSRDTGSYQPPSTKIAPHS